MLINEIIQTSQQLYLLTPMLGEDAGDEDQDIGGTTKLWVDFQWREIY